MHSSCILTCALKHLYTCTTRKLDANLMLLTELLVSAACFSLSKNRFRQAGIQRATSRPLNTKPQHNATCHVHTDCNLFKTCTDILCRRINANCQLSKCLSRLHLVIMIHISGTPPVYSGPYDQADWTLSVAKLVYEQGLWPCNQICVAVWITQTAPCRSRTCELPAALAW